MQLELRPAVDFHLSELAAITSAGFEDYFVPISFTKESLATMMRFDGVDLNSSRVILKDGNPVGAALIAHRGWTSRLAAMGVSKEARGSGIGKWAMQELIKHSRERGERSMVLEVIEQNEPGVRLYQGCGFELVRRLVGYSLENPDSSAADSLTEIDVRQVARVLSDHGPADLPWQASAATLGQQGPPFCAYQMGPAYAVISDPERDYISIRSLVVEQEHRNQGHAKRILQALFATHKQKTWSVPVICPEETAPQLFQNLGFSREKLSQFQMELKHSQ